jgi:hypothetical protein
MKFAHARRGIAVGVGILAAATTAHAATIIQQSGKSNPLKHRFAIVTCCGSGATGKGKMDHGVPVWAMGAGDTGDQFGYARPLTAGQTKTITKKGFVLTVIARVIQGSAPVYSQSTPVTIGDSLVDATSSVRWEMDIGIDADGDPVVVLPNTIDNAGPGGSVESYGASYVLTGAGSSYNKYQLVVQSGTASLYVNGTQVLTGYTGETDYVSNAGVVFTVNSGGRTNYNLVELTSTTTRP